MAPGRRRRKKARSAKSRRTWVVRGGLVVACSALGFLSVTDSLARWLVRHDPGTAFVLAPNDGLIAAAKAQQVFMLAPDGDPNSKAGRLVRLALADDPTATDALDVLAFQAQLRNDTHRARRIFSYSLLLSRRELKPQMWAIEEAVKRGDIGEVLRNYDNALRTSREARTLLYPILAEAIAQPQIRARLGRILRSRPVWGKEFLEFIAVSPINPQAALALFSNPQNRGLPITDTTRAGLVTSLVRAGDHRSAWELYRSFHPGADPRRSRDPGFAFRTNTPAPFDWITTSQGNISAALLDKGTAGMLDFSVPPGVGGEVVRQLQLLPPGTYRIEGRSRGIDQPDRSRPYWSLTCMSGVELGHVTVPNSASDSGAFRGTIVVPGSCPVQALSLVARASDQMTGSSGQFFHLSLVPMQK